MRQQIGELLVGRQLKGVHVIAYKLFAYFSVHRSVISSSFLLVTDCSLCSVRSGPL